MDLNFLFYFNIYNFYYHKWVEDLLDATECVEESLILNPDTIEVSQTLKSEFMTLEKRKPALTSSHSLFILFLMKSNKFLQKLYKHHVLQQTNI